MTTLYKDFDKDSKDLLTKNFGKPGDWKVENKAKATKGNYAVSTTSNARGEVSVDVEGLTADGACYGKLTVTPKELQDFKATIRAENIQGHKVEGVLTQKGPSFSHASIEVSHETLQPLTSGRLRIHDKITQKSVELGLSMAAAQGVQVGCGATYDYKAGNCAWTAGCRAAATERTTVTVQTKALRDVSVNVLTMAPLHPKFQPRIAANVSMDLQSNAWDGAVAADWGCRVVLGNVARARINKNMEWMLSYTAALTGGWTLTLSFDKTMKTGVTLTRN